ncbi:MAG: TonB family protein [Myxococcaceae bacterium]
MFELFETRADPKAVQRLSVSAGGAFVLGAVALGLLVASSGNATPTPPKEASMEVVFKPPPPPPPPVPKAEPPPPPPPPPKQAPPKVVKSSPPKVARATPPPRLALVAPKEVPLEKPKEQEPVADPAPVEHEEPTDEVEGSGEYVGREVDQKATAAAPPAPKPVILPEDGVPPVALPSNPMPDFPPEARAKGQEGMVILRLVVTAAGEVTKVELLKGNEPFASAAVAAVKSWRYKPALSGGQPIAVFQTLRIPFRLRN